MSRDSLLNNTKRTKKDFKKAVCERYQVFFQLGFFYIHESQDCRGRGRAFP